MRRIALALAGLVGAATLAAPAAAYEIDPLTREPLMGWGVAPAAVQQPVYRPQAHAAPRQVVRYDGRQTPGTVVVSTSERRLYYVLGNGQAVRYGVGVGRPGFTWAGSMNISMKREWPDWRPPAPMLRRRPDLPRHMKGGPDNPLGARALYLFQGGRDTLYRIHGTAEVASIGRQVSSGCIRLLNADVIDLYQRVPVGTRVLVLKHLSPDRRSV